MEFHFGNGIIVTVKQTDHTSGAFVVQEPSTGRELNLPPQRRGTVSNHIIARHLYLVSVVTDFDELQTIYDDNIDKD